MRMRYKSTKKVVNVMGSVAINGSSQFVPINELEAIPDRESDVYMDVFVRSCANMAGRYSSEQVIIIADELASEAESFLYNKFNNK